MPAQDRIGFYCSLPPDCVKEIRRQSQKQKLPQWMIVANALADASLAALQTGGLGRKAKGRR